MNDDVLLQGAGRKLRASLDIFFASIDAYIDFDPARAYTPKELEPYDALSDRFLRAFESSIRYFRTLERVREVAPSESFCDLLNRMEKYRAITAAGVWLEMRDTRNRIAQEYLPEEQAKLYRAIVGPAATELLHVRSTIGGAAA